MNGIKDFKVPQYMDIAHPDRGFSGICCDANACLRRKFS